MPEEKRLSRQAFQEMVDSQLVGQLEAIKLKPYPPESQVKLMWDNGLAAVRKSMNLEPEKDRELAKLQAQDLRLSRILLEDIEPFESRTDEEKISLHEPQRRSTYFNLLRVLIEETQKMLDFGVLDQPLAKRKIERRDMMAGIVKKFQNRLDGLERGEPVTVTVGELRRWVESGNTVNKWKTRRILGAKNSREYYERVEYIRKVITDAI